MQVQTDREAGRQADREKVCQAGRQAESKEVRQTDRWTERKTHTQS